MKMKIFIMLLLPSLCFAQLLPPLFQERMPNVQESKLNICKRKFGERNIDSNYLQLTGKICTAQDLAFITESKIYEVTWHDYFQCFNKLKPFENNGFNIYRDCSKREVVRWVRTNNFNSCTNVAKRLFPFSAYQQLRLCWNQNDASKIIGGEFQKCEKSIAKFSPNGQQVLNLCSRYVNSHPSFQKYFPQCSAKLHKIKSGLMDVEDICFDKYVLHIISCMDKNSDILTNNGHLLSKCQEKSFRQGSKYKNFRSCLRKLNKVEGLRFEDSSKLCSIDDNKTTQIATSSRYSVCVKKFVNDLKMERVQAHSSCLVDDVTKQIEDSKFKGCLDSGVTSASPNFFYFQSLLLQEDFNRTQFHDLEDLNPYHTLIKDCLADTKISHDQNSNPYLKFISDFNFHSNDIFEQAGVLLGGISAIRYSANEKAFYFLSDGNGSSLSPHIYVYDFDINQDGKMIFSENKAIKLSFSSSGSLNGFHNEFSMDPEGLDITKQGNFIITSETQDSESDDFISVFSEYGHRKGRINLDEEFHPSMNNRSKGLQYNKGMESLSLTPNKGHLFTANEASLRQDFNLMRPSRCPFFFTSSGCGKSGDVVRIIKFKNNNENYREVGQYYYQLEDHVDNGLVEILALDENTLLTLERSWDPRERLVTSKIYHVSLKNAYNLNDHSKMENEIVEGKTLKKILVLDLADITQRLSPGFRNIDNLESMSFGPRLQNGTNTLVLASDNNFSTIQRTSILLFEIDLNKIKRIK